MGTRHARLICAAPLLGSLLLGNGCIPTALAQAIDGDPPDARAARDQLVRHVAATRRVRDARVLAALRTVPRHRFIDAPLDVAYLDRPLSIGHGQTISQPLVVGMMTQALALTGRERVLEIGTGSGYQAAVLSLLSAHVDSIEIVPALGEKASERLRALGYRNVTVRIGDGYRGWPEDAPFDRIMLTAAPPELPAALVEQLADGGILVAPVGESRDQRLRRWKKVGGKLIAEDLGPVRFVPMVHAGR